MYQQTTTVAVTGLIYYVHIKLIEVQYIGDQI